MEKKNLIVFDIDDTLTKSEFQHQLAYVNTMKYFGIKKINLNWKEYKHHTDSFILKENYENNFSKKFNFSFIRLFEKEMTKEILTLKITSEINGARQMIDYILKEANYGISFATGSLLKPAYIKLEQAGIKYEKNLVVGSNAIFEREGIVLKAIERAKSYYNNHNFENIISIGDGIWDLKTAKNLDIHFMGIGIKNLADFKQESIKSHIKDWSEFDLKNVEKELGIKN